MHQQRFAFPNRHGGNRKHDWARKQKRRGKQCPVPHRRRCEVEERFPMHVTLRLRDGLESLRRRQTYAVVCQALCKGKEYGEFRLHQFSVQSNHLHLIVEASDRVSLARGVQGLAIRIAKGLNRIWERRGKVFAERYHALVLRSARQIRNALRYVLGNAFKHDWSKVLNGWFDPCSSAAWFDGWRGWDGQPLRARSFEGALVPVVAARGYLLRVGWRRWGLLDPTELPKGGA